MFNKLFAGLMAMAVALTGLPIVAFASVEVGDNLKLFGDFRFRSEYDDRSPAKNGNQDARERQRIRLRFGAKYQTALDNVSFGFRLATGSNSLNSPHQTLGLGAGGGTNGDFGLDRAYAKIKFLESGAFIVGKMGYPFWQQTEQFWDEDIQPEGFALAYNANLGDAGSLTAAAAYYYISNNGWAKSLFDNDTATVFQIAYKGNVGGVKPTLAFTGLSTDDGNSSGDWAAVGVSNDPTFYMASAQIKGNASGIKWRVGGDFQFSDAEVIGKSDNHDTGFVVNVRVKKDKYGVRYYYYDVEEFATPSYAGVVFSQDNLPNSSNSAPIGFEGHRIQFDYKIAKGISTDFRIYRQTGKSDNYGYGESPNADRNRYQLNVNFKF